MASKKTYEQRIKEASEFEKEQEYKKAIAQLEAAIKNFPDDAKADGIEDEIERIKSLIPKEFKPTDMVDFELYHTLNYKDGIIGPGIVKLPYEMKQVFESETMKRIGKCLV